MLLVAFAMLPVACVAGLNAGYALWHDPQVPLPVVVQQDTVFVMQPGDTVQFNVTVNGCEVAYGPLDVPREGFSAWGLVCPDGEEPDAS